MVKLVALVGLAAVVGCECLGTRTSFGIFWLINLIWKFLRHPRFHDDCYVTSVNQIPIQFHPIIFQHLYRLGFYVDFHSLKLGIYIASSAMREHV